MTTRLFDLPGVLWSAGDAWWIVERDRPAEGLTDLIMEPLSQLPDSDEWRQQMQAKVLALYDALRLDPEGTIADIEADWCVDDIQYFPYEPGKPALVIALLSRSVPITIN